MCLILFSYKTHPDYKLILAANRDEFYERPTRPAHFRDDRPDILAGEDIQANGTWMGITKAGRFAALTNYRAPADMVHNRHSRGLLVYDFLKSDISPASYLSLFNETTTQYNGYNLIAGDIDTLYYYSNKTESCQKLDAGIYGLSNALLDTSWPKVDIGKQKLTEITSEHFTTEDLFTILRNDKRAQDDKLPSTGVSLEFEQLLSPMYIESEQYGTRSSTVITIDYDNRVNFTERTYHKNNEPSDVVYEFEIS
ncbi:MAG: hypothetical protein C0603_10730 [Denitrovibrio sp.]|nr:MAG: hypothetical protein C0603_10730 [Denitrovibrio sp.]